MNVMKAETDALSPKLFVHTVDTSLRLAVPCGPPQKECGQKRHNLKTGFQDKQWQK